MRMFDRILLMITIVVIILFFAINKLYKNTKVDIESLNKEYIKITKKNNDLDQEIQEKNAKIEELKDSSKVMEY